MFYLIVSILYGIINPITWGIVIVNLMAFRVKKVQRNIKALKAIQILDGVLIVLFSILIFLDQVKSFLVFLTILDEKGNFSGMVSFVLLLPLLVLIYFCIKITNYINSKKVKITNNKLVVEP